MLPEHSPLAELRAALNDGSATPRSIAENCIARANANASHNTYIHFDPDALLAQAATLDPAAPLYGVPVSLKDLFDLAGTHNSAGTKFYQAERPVAVADSSIAARLKSTGCMITGKTHLHPLAYGITGENPEFGDCVQPRDAGLLTGGSSSGAAASVQEGSALAAIGTDTGGSVRMPAALCGLVGYRASLSLPAAWPDATRGMWLGGMHLAQSFDTMGLLLRDPRDLPELAGPLFGLGHGAEWPRVRIGCVAQEFASDANPDVLAAYDAWKQALKANGAEIVDFEPNGWSASTEILTGIQAHEAAAIHRRYFDRLLPSLDPAIQQRLRWGASLTEDVIDSLRSRHAYFRAAIAALLAQFDLLMVPSGPINRLRTGEDHTQARAAILRYTSPFSLSGLPVVTLPGELLGAPLGTGVQLAAPQMEDASLLRFVANLKL